MRRKSAHRWVGGEREREIGRVAARQHTIVRADQLMALGFSRRGVVHRAATGRLHRLYPGVYALGRPDIPLKGRWLAAVYACGPGAVLANRAAAALHGLTAWRGGRIDVAIPTRSRRHLDGITIHRPIRLGTADITEVDGIPCASLERTLLDIAATGPPWLLRTTVNQAEIEQALDVDAVIRMLVRLPRHPGSRRLRSALDIDEVGLDRTKTPLESRFLALCCDAGLPYPAVNEAVAVPGEEWQCDFVWHGRKLVVEVDGWKTHRTRQAFAEDRRRDRLLRLAGWTVLRFTWADVTARAAEVASTVGALLDETGG